MPKRKPTNDSGRAAKKRVVATPPAADATAADGQTARRLQFSRDKSREAVAASGTCQYTYEPTRSRPRHQHSAEQQREAYATDHCERPLMKWARLPARTRARAVFEDLTLL